MPRVVVSNTAGTDIREILIYLETRAGRHTALRYALDLEATVDR